jgi:hypothetical protein
MIAPGKKYPEISYSMSLNHLDGIQIGRSVLSTAPHQLNVEFGIIAALHCDIRYRVSISDSSMIEYSIFLNTVRDRQ